MIGTGIAERTAEIGAKWAAASEELGCADEGGFEDVDDWFSPDETPPALQ
ncbi:hypothetical protein GCM10022261_03010 [Brevibacterium daeguense]|uniref:Uncharacterized protein n=1 Tax=Brevibacterium daeguense TaxID=909936 RepID=A0ABP8EFX0_9MICO|nr:hypothetical protein [Brevibacterium daeguense]